jgi:hypothetical protein
MTGNVPGGIVDSAIGKGCASDGAGVSNIM